VTLDDITELLSAQRTGAWADVARRIAHEIKNPLTPIQLSAERLRRRYSSKLADDLDVFDKCINTIVRQVGAIGTMVDEFSSFARMPEARPEKGDLTDAIRQAVFLASARRPRVAEGPPFARMPEARPERGDLPAARRQAGCLESARLPEVSVTMDRPEEPIIALFDARLSAQVLTNLIKNAVEAIEGAGI